MLWKMDRGQAEEQFDNVGSTGFVSLFQLLDENRNSAPEENIRRWESTLFGLDRLRVVSAGDAILLISSVTTSKSLGSRRWI